MKKESWLTCVFLLIGWTLFSLLIDNNVLLPTPLEVLEAMWIQMLRQDFLAIILSTSYRVIKGCLLSLMCAGLLGILSANFKPLERFFAPTHQLIKTIPNITYMILILIWLGHENSVTVIVFCILFPVFYAEFLQRTRQITENTCDLLKIYPVSWQEKIFKIDLPMLLPEVFCAVDTGIGMGFKICVMAEILGQVKTGIGRQMNYARLNLDLASVFGWTLWLMLISFALCQLLRFVSKITCRKSKEKGSSFQSTLVK